MEMSCSRRAFRPCALIVSILLISCLVNYACASPSEVDLPLVESESESDRIPAFNEADISSTPTKLKLNRVGSEMLLLRSFGAESGAQSKHSKKNLPVPILTIPNSVSDPSKQVAESGIVSKKHQQLSVKPEATATQNQQGQVHYVDMSNLLEQNCLETDNITQRACFEYCTMTTATSSPKFDAGKCEGGQNVCICENTKNGSSKRVKLYKPKPKPALVPTRKRKISPSQTKLIPMRERGSFDCDNSPEANSICQVFCTTKGATHAACALDQKSCLCFKSQSKSRAKKKHVHASKRSGRQWPFAEQVQDDDPTAEKLIGLGLVIREDPSIVSSSMPSDSGSDPTTRQLPYWSPPFQLYPQQHMQSPGCTPFSCVDNCPRHCDNMCTQNLQCFCSCSEDTVYYDYVDDDPAYPAFSFFG